MEFFPDDLVFNEILLWYKDVLFYQHIGCSSHRNIIRIISHLSTSESLRDLPNKLGLKYIKWCFAAQHIFPFLLGRITQLSLGNLILPYKAMCFVLSLISFLTKVMGSVDWPKSWQPNRFGVDIRSEAVQ